MLYIPEQIVSNLYDHAKNGLPEEVCGYLAGTDREVIRQFRLTNYQNMLELDKILFLFITVVKSVVISNRCIENVAIHL